MKYKAIFDVPDGYLIGCASAKIIMNDGRTHADTEYKDIYAVTRPIAEREEAGKEYCLSCRHVEMCRWYPCYGCDFREE